MGKSDANECNESSLSNCRVQLALSTKRDGVILEKRYCNEEPNITLFKILIGVTTCYISGDAVMLIYEKTPHLFSDEEHYLEMEVDFLQPFLDIEARTALANPGKVAMT